MSKSLSVVEEITYQKTLSKLQKEKKRNSVPTYQMVLYALIQTAAQLLAIYALGLIHNPEIGLISVFVAPIVFIAINVFMYFFTKDKDFKKYNLISGITFLASFLAASIILSIT